MSRALFYTLIPGAGESGPPRILVVTQVTARFLRGRLFDGALEFERPRRCVGHFTNPTAALAALRAARTIHAAHRIAARSLEAQLTALGQRRDAELAALVPAFTEEHRHAA